MSHKKTITLGLLEPALSVQLAGFISPEDGELLDRDNNAINHCLVRGLVGRGEVDRARDRLLKSVKVAVDRCASCMSKRVAVSQTSV